MAKIFRRRGAGSGDAGRRSKKGHVHARRHLPRSMAGRGRCRDLFLARPRKHPPGADPEKTPSPWHANRLPHVHVPHVTPRPLRTPWKRGDPVSLRNSPRMSKEVVLDIETQNTFQEVGSYDHSKLKISVIGVYFYETDE